MPISTVLLTPDVSTWPEVITVNVWKGTSDRMMEMNILDALDVVSCNFYPNKHSY